MADGCRWRSLVNLRGDNFSSMVVEEDETEDLEG